MCIYICIGAFAGIYFYISIRRPTLYSRTYIIIICTYISTYAHDMRNMHIYVYISRGRVQGMLFYVYIIYIICIYTSPMYVFIYVHIYSELQANTVIFSNRLNYTLAMTRQSYSQQFTIFGKIPLQKREKIRARVQLMYHD